MKRKRKEQPLEERPSFICSLSGTKVYSAGHGHALRFNGIDYPISNISCTRMAQMIGLSQGHIDDRGVIQVRRIIDDHGNVENDLEFLIDLDNLVAVPEWRKRVKKMISGAATHSMPLTSQSSANRFAATSRILDGVRSQPEIVFGG